MPADTTRYSFPYQQIGDAPDGPALGQDLAQTVETALGVVDDAVTALDTRIDALEATAVIAAVEAKDGALTNGTTTSTAFTNTLTTSLIRGVTFTAPPSGKVTVTVSTGGFNSTAAQYTLVDFEVRAGATIGSGTVIRASDENSCSQFQSSTATQAGQHSVSGVVTGLTPGTTYHASITYRVTANTGTFNRRKIIVTPVR